MADIFVEKQVCTSCGADLRNGALFCYNCGGAVSGVPDKIENKNGNSAHDDTVQRNNAARTQLKDKKSAIIARNKISEAEIGGEQKLDEPEQSAQEELKTAAALRRKPKTIRKKEVEIVWEEQENPSSLLLILTALLLAIFAAAVIILAMTLK